MITTDMYETHARAAWQSMPPDTIVTIVLESSSPWEIAGNIVLIAGVFIALLTYWWSRRQKIIENTIAVAEREMYDAHFQTAAAHLEVALHNPRFMNTSPFRLPRKYRDAWILFIGHYKAVLARVDERLIDPTLYRKILPRLIHHA